MSLTRWSQDNAHPAEELWEEYCLGRVQEPALAQLEEHLLVCEVCQETLANLEEYIALFKAAVAPVPGEGVAQILPSAKQPLAVSFRKTKWLAALRAPQLPRLVGIGVALGLLALSSSSVAHRPLTGKTVTEETVYLTGYRGGSAGATEAQGHARRPLQLTLEFATGAAPAYRFEVVDEIGRSRWSGDATAGTDVNANQLASASRIIAHVKSGLPAGHYWVRLLANPAAAAQPPLGEFGLTIRE